MSQASRLATPTRAQNCSGFSGTSAGEPGRHSGIHTSPGSTRVNEITGLTLEAIVPAFAEGAGVFVLEHLLKGGEPVGHRGGGEVVMRRLGTTFARAGQRVSREAFPPGQVIAFAPGSPYARCMDTGGPVTFAEPDGPTLERLRPDGREVVSRCSSFLAVPLTARDTVVGMLAFARDPGGPRSAAATTRPPPGWEPRPERRSSTR